MPSKGDYEVGYGKPPCHSRFKKGQSGNPKGRPSDAKSLSILLEQALNERIIITEGGRRRKVTKLRAFVEQLVDRSTGGDLRAGKILIEMHRDNESRTQPAAPEATFTAADEKVIEQLTARLRGGKRESDD